MVCSRNLVSPGRQGKFLAVLGDIVKAWGWDGVPNEATIALPLIKICTGRGAIQTVPWRQEQGAVTEIVIYFDERQSSHGVSHSWMHTGQIDNTVDGSTALCQPIDTYIDIYIYLYTSTYKWIGYAFDPIWLFLTDSIWMTLSVWFFLYLYLMLCFPKPAMHPAQN